MAVDALYLVRSLSEETQENYIPQPNEPVIGTEEGKPVLKFGDGKSSIAELEPAAGASGGTPNGSEVDLTPKHEVTKTFEEDYFAYGTPAYVSKDSNNNVTEYIPDKIVSGLAYRFWKEDSAKPGSADYSAKQATEAAGKAAFAVGTNNKSMANYATTFGSHNINSSYCGFVAGSYNTALGDYTYGTDDPNSENFEANEKQSQYSTMMSRQGIAGAHLVFTEGWGKKAYSSHKGKIDFKRIEHGQNADTALFDYWKGLSDSNKFLAAMGDMSHVGGLNSLAGAPISFAFGEACYTGGMGAVAFGKNTQSKGSQAFAAGFNTKALGDNSIALGVDTKAEGAESFAGGNDVAVSGLHSFGFGNRLQVTGDHAVAFGGSNTVSAKFSAAFGSDNSVSASNSFAFGAGHIINAPNAVAFGSGQDIDGSYGVALGHDNSVKKDYGVAIGYESTASEAASIGIGYRAKAAAPKQMVVGQFNEQIQDEKACFIVGVGNSSKLLNGLVAYSDGHVEIGGQGTTSKSVVRKDYVDKQITNVNKTIQAEEARERENLKEKVYVKREKDISSELEDRYEDGVKINKGTYFFRNIPMPDVEFSVNLNPNYDLNTTNIMYDLTIDDVEANTGPYKNFFSIFSTDWDYAGDYAVLALSASNLHNTSAYYTGWASADSTTSKKRKHASNNNS